MQYVPIMKIISLSLRNEKVDSEVRSNDSMVLWWEASILSYLAAGYGFKATLRLLSVHFSTPISKRVRSNSQHRFKNVPRASLHNELTSASAQSGLRHSSVASFKGKYALYIKR